MNWDKYFDCVYLLFDQAYEFLFKAAIESLILTALAY